VASVCGEHQLAFGQHVREPCSHDDTLAVAAPRSNL
jgi:hypothetical protein